MSPTWRIALFVSTLVLVLGGLGLHVYRRVTRSFSLPRWVQRAFAATLALGVFAAVVGRFIGQRAPSLSALLGAFGGVVTLGILISSVLLWPYEILSVVTRLILALRKPPRATVPDPARRSFLKQAAVGSAVSVGMGAATYGTLIGRHDYTLETVPIKLAKLPRALDGFSIVQLSDIHVGLFVGDYELKRALELVERAKPDIVVLTGDLIDNDISHAPRLARFAQSLRAYAPRGVFAIPGNHDHYTGATRVLNMLRETGTDVLNNRHVRIGEGKASFVLAGLDDVAGPQFGSEGPNLEKAFFAAPDELARVLLSHNPAYFPSSYRSADLTLSGHTHGGQITLFINPAELVLSHGLVRGHYVREDSQLYVNRGFGTAGPPARVGSTPEVTKLILTT